MFIGYCAFKRQAQLRLIVCLASVVILYRPLRYERMYLALYKVADTSFHTIWVGPIPISGCLFLDNATMSAVPENSMVNIKLIDLSQFLLKLCIFCVCPWLRDGHVVFRLLSCFLICL